MTTAVKTLKFKIYDNVKTKKKFDKWIAITRYVYNLAKETKEVAYSSGVILSNYDLQKQFTQCKKEAVWLKEVHSSTLLATFDRLDLAYSKFKKEIKNGTISKQKAKYLTKQSKNGRVVNWKKYNDIGKPKWAKKRIFNTIDFKSVKLKNNQFILPKFGTIKVHNPEYIAKHKIVKLRTASITESCGDLYLNVVVDIELPIKSPCSKNQAVGLDLGIAHYATLSNGIFYENPKHLAKYILNLKQEQVKLNSKSKTSKSYEKQKIKIAKIHRKIKNCRLDFIQKLTNELAAKYETIVVEDLKISDMVHDSEYAKSILDCAWGLFIDLLSKKTNVIKVNPAYTSQTCSSCKLVDKNSRVSQSEFICTSCGHTENADINGSKNILDRALSK
jgi:putative transposase